MATKATRTVFNVEQIELLDGNVVTLKPLNIKMLKQFNKMLEGLGELDEDDDGIQAVVDIAGFCVSRENPEYLEEENSEEAFDIETVYYVIEKCTGVKLNDPEAMKRAMDMAAQALADQQTNSGKTS